MRQDWCTIGLFARCLASIAFCVAPLHFAAGASGSENAALHYHRAILFLGAVDADARDVLANPIWETATTLGEESGREKANRLLFAGRHAVRSAIAGSRRPQADFGLDSEAFAQSPFLPHCAPMGDLAHLVTLHGLQLQGDQHWKEAADAHLAVLRMGRHMTHQSTLAEAVVGARMLESGFYGLSMWASGCPDPGIASQALAEFSMLAEGMIDLEAVMKSELKLRRTRQEQLLREFPDGAWDEMLLDVLGLDPAEGEPDRVRETALAAAADRGVPREVFRDRNALADYVQQLQSLYADYTQAVIDCTKLASTRERLIRGAEIHERFESRFEKLGNPAEIHPGQLVAFMASHHAERTLTRTMLALATVRTSEGFPADLAGVAGALGGSVPASPYDGSPLVYEPSEDRLGYVLTVREATIGGITLPEIEFKSTGELSVPR
jgi:hypothetical protein